MEDSFTTGFKGVAIAVLHHVLQQSLHKSNLAHFGIQFLELFRRELLPTLRRGSSSNEPGEQFMNLFKSESRLLSPLHDGKSVKDTGVVSSLSANPFRRFEQSDLLVVTDRGGP